jgi:deaminated glutathione amidase
VADRLRVACIQLNASDSKAENIERAGGLVARAASTGADLVVLPEKWNGIGPPDFLRANAETLDGETVEAMSSWARDHKVTLLGGSIAERREGREKLSNTCLVFDPEGEIVALYRKIHMFDVEVGGQVYRESESEEAGEETARLSEVEGWKLGLTVCYDLRFPELYRILAVEGAEVIAVPAAFTLFTGKDHWELLLRARAVENQCYVVAADQWGTHGDGKASYGRSMIVDPWGLVIAQAADEDGVIAAELDRTRIQDVRRALPSLANRQPAAYRWPAEV